MCHLKFKGRKISNVEQINSLVEEATKRFCKNKPIKQQLKMCSLHLCYIKYFPKQPFKKNISFNLRSTIGLVILQIFENLLLIETLIKDVWCAHERFKLLVNSLENSKVDFTLAGQFCRTLCCQFKSLNCFQVFYSPQVQFRNSGRDFRQTSYSALLEFPMHE